MEIEKIDWLKNIKKNTLKFLNSMSYDNFSYIKYSYSGDFYTSKDFWGLGNFVFAVKILSIIDALNDLDKKSKTNLYNGIIKFSNNGGLIFDPLVTKIPIFKKLVRITRNGYSYYKDSIEKTRKAETRQSYSALFLLDKKPLEPLKSIPKSESEIVRYLNNLNWEHPWGAGAHFSLLLFFLKMNHTFFPEKEQENNELIKLAINWVNKIQSKEDGSWYIGNNVSLYQKINGAMKVLTGLHACGIYDFNYPKKLIDLALIATNDRQACDNINLIYVLYACSLIEPNYRKEEIEVFLLSRLKIFKDYFFPDYGGFSFFKGHANNNYYGFNISKGRNEPDIHGTVLFLWGIALINKILNLNLNLLIPLT